MAESPALDPAVIDELREIMGDDFDTLVASYIRDGRQRLQALHDAFSEGAEEQIRQQAHSFKGSSGNLGALRVTDICLQIEQFARERDLAGAGVLMEALENEFQKSCDALLNL